VRLPLFSHRSVTTADVTCRITQFFQLGGVTLPTRHLGQLLPTASHCFFFFSFFFIFFSFFFHYFFVHPPSIAPDAPNQRRATPLHRAAAKHRADCCRALLAHGADVSACDADGMRPSQVARDPATAALLQNAEMAKEMGMGDESSGDDDES
jgi:hypothetical protein